MEGRIVGFTSVRLRNRPESRSVAILLTVHCRRRSSTCVIDTARSTSGFARLPPPHDRLDAACRCGGDRSGMRFRRGHERCRLAGAKHRSRATEHRHGSLLFPLRSATEESSGSLPATSSRCATSSSTLAITARSSRCRSRQSRTHADRLPIRDSPTPRPARRSLWTSRTAMSAIVVTRPVTSIQRGGGVMVP